MIKAIRVCTGIAGVIAAVTLACGGLSPSKAKAGEGATAAGGSANPAELKRILDRVMAPPEIRTEAGFTARVLVAPGELYDPLFMRTHGNAVWVNDDGGQDPKKPTSKGGGQGRIVAVDGRGNVSEVVGIGRFFGPPLGLDIAPASFAPYQGQLFTVSQPYPLMKGAVRGHIVERIDLTTQGEAERFCALPPAGEPWPLRPGEPPDEWTLHSKAPDGKGVASGGMEGRFGPEDSPFAGRFFAVTVINATVYQVTPDGKCTSFVSFDGQKWGFPVGLGFTPDGQHLLVSMYQVDGMTPERATIARVRPDGTVEPEQLVRTSPDRLISLGGMAYAPAGFGDYGGQLFLAANNEKYGDLQEKHRTHEMPKAGEVYRLTHEGELKLVATGFYVTFDVHFFGNRLWVSDINGDYTTMAARELPDGFIVEIAPSP